MNMVQIGNSSNVKAIGYEANRLRIEYLNGLIYEYLNVPESTHKELMAQESKGSYIHRKIRNGFASIKVQESKG